MPNITSQGLYFLAGETTQAVMMAKVTYPVEDSTSGNPRILSQDDGEDWDKVPPPHVDIADRGNGHVSGDEQGKGPPYATPKGIALARWYLAGKLEHWRVEAG